MVDQASALQNRIDAVRQYFIRLDARRADVLDLFTEDFQFYFPKYGLGRGKDELQEQLLTEGLGQRSGQVALLVVIEGDRAGDARDQSLAAARMATDMVADDLLRMALGIEVRGVEEVAAELDVAIQDLLRFLDAGTPTKIFTESHCTKANFRHGHTRVG